GRMGRRRVARGLRRGRRGGGARVLRMNEALTIGGCEIGPLLGAVGTPALIVDEDTLRDTARAYAAAFGAGNVYFASKAFPCPGVIRVFAEEGLGCDVASDGELALALAGGMPAERILMHGNAKTDAELSAAL